MIKRVEILLNVIHYCWYKADYKIHLLSNRINPAFLLGEIPSIKRKLVERKVSPKEVVNKLWGDKRYGHSVMTSGTGLILIVFCMIWAVFLLLNSLLIYPIGFSWKPFVICAVLAFLICYATIFRKDKYLSYFKQFEKWSDQQKRKYAVLSIAFFVGGIALLIYSFRWLP